MTHREQILGLEMGALKALLLMHLWMTADGTILSTGPTLAKIIGGGEHLGDLFQNGRAGDTGTLLDRIDAAAENGDRLFLRMRQAPHLNLRGNAVRAQSGTVLLNLGFGIEIYDAVRIAGLTDADFAPPELAMELLFMREAIGGVLGELSRFNSQLEAAREAAEVQAHTDPLTGLRNRRGLELALGNALRLARDGDATGKGTGFALAHLDLDHFKQVNDLLGHAAGDLVLRHVARVLQEVTRSDDTAARIGGDEFVLILKGLEDPDMLKRLAARIIAGIEAALDQQEDCGVSASMGIVLSRFYKNLSAERMLADSDAALYRSKRDGRARVTIIDAPGAD